MSVRVTLSDFEAQHVIAGLMKLREEGISSYPVTQAGQHVYDEIIKKLTPKEDTSKITE